MPLAAASADFMPECTASLLVLLLAIKIEPNDFIIPSLHLILGLKLAGRYVIFLSAIVSKRKRCQRKKANT
jgi:hypothetical protein